MNYFSGMSTVGQVKSEYRKLAKLNHPDLGGVTAVMQAINAAYCGLYGTGDISPTGASSLERQGLTPVQFLLNGLAQQDPFPENGAWQQHRR